MSSKMWAPSWGGLCLVGVFFLIGLLLGSFATLAMTGAGCSTQACLLVSYPLMFLPAVLFTVIMTRKEGAVTCALDVPVKSPVKVAPIVMLMTFMAAFMADALNTLLPEMPQWLIDSLSTATEGNFWLNFLCVCVMAPILEEWLCRGMVLRGLVRGGSPAWLAITVSAAFFAIIHGNMWQALPAFLLGCLFGYVYYRTGSIKLTMLMHFTNNFISLILSRVPSIDDTDTWMDIMPLWLYWLLFVLFALMLVLGIRTIRRIYIVDTKNISSPLKG